MAINPHRKGGPDVPVTDGGTSASDAATALSNLGGLDTAAHASIDHSGIPGAGGGAETESVTNSPGLGNNISRLIPANTLSTNNESLTWELWGIASGADTIDITLGGLTLVPANATDVGEQFIFRGTILRTGPTASQCVTTYTPDGTGSVNLALTRVSTPAVDWATNLTLLAFDASNQVTFTALIIRKWSA